MKRPPRPVIAAVVLSLAGLGTWWFVASRGDDLTIEASGTVEATEADLGFQVAGLLEGIGAREGDRVSAGSELATLERSELLAEREVALAQVEAAQALLAEYLAGSRKEEIARARALLAVAVERRDAARRDVERLRNLAEQQLVSRQSFDHQETDFSVAEGEMAKAQEDLRLLESGTRPERIAAQRAALAQAEASLQRIEAQLAQSTIKAPFAGTITVRHREPGEAIASGSPVLTVQNLSDRWVRTYVPGDDVGRLTLGQCASIKSDGFTERNYTGVVSYIASVAEFTPRNVQSTKDRVRLVYEVRVRIVGDDSIDLKPGLPGDVTFSAADPGAADIACSRPTAAPVTVTGG
jgi:HlyD family secretion protein